MRISVKLFDGFTLIELMVVVLVISVLAGGSIAAFLNFNRREQLASDVRNLLTEVNKARSLAATQQYPSGCTTLEGINLRSTLIDGSLTGVILTTQCFPANVVNPEVKILQNTVFAIPFDVTFLPGSGYLDGDDVDIVVQLPEDSSVTKILHIGSYGSASIQ